MKFNVLQLIFLGLCAAITIYFTYATIALVPQEIITTEGTVTIGFLDYGMIQFYLFMSVIAFLLYMLAGGSK
jgi:hypothetical protein